VHEFVETGGRAVVTCVDLSRLDASWLGRTVDERFVDEIAATVVDTCGENGEYHSFAFQGAPCSLMRSPGSRAGCGPRSDSASST